MAKYNDLDMENWKGYDDILTDSLWIIDKRDSSGVHNASYHGNFVPQIPNQLFRRYTKKGDWILDPFAGGGTSLIEAQRLGRNAIGIELQEDVAKAAHDLVEQEKTKDFSIFADIFWGVGYQSLILFLTQIFFYQDCFQKYLLRSKKRQVPIL